jgi:hypothetical protein
MRRTEVWMIASVLLGMSSVACSGATESGLVAFGSHSNIGRWASESGAGGAIVPPAAASGGLAAPVPFPGTSGGAGGRLPNAGASGGRPDPVVATGGSVAAGSGGHGSAAGSGATGVGGTNGAAGASPDQSGPTSLAFDVLTAPQGGLYQPRNIGAIWVQDSNGTFIKSLEVWAGIRSRYLSKYAAARSGMPVDVVASATLSSHRTHHATWNMKDRSGAAAPSGKYTVFIELTDADRTGKFASVDFDTSLGPQMINPPDAQYFSAMKLQLQ